MSGHSPVGILGGTFDPPHFGHLLLAECARVQFHLERVVFMPAGDPYRKANRTVTPASHRLAMVRLAIAGNQAFEADPLEVERAGPTYTADTLDALAARGIESPLLIFGSDALADMPNWQRLERITACPIAIAAKGTALADVAALAGRAGMTESPPVVDMPRLDVSGTEIRARLSAGLPVRYMLPDPVLAYIAEHHLYRPENR